MSGVGRVVALPLLWLVRGYQRFVSPLTPPSCRYYPSCSAYAVTALERFGPVRGLGLAVRRLLRCHPWTPGGVDHVPDRDPATGRPVPGTTGPKPYRAAGGTATDDSDVDGARGPATGPAERLVERPPEDAGPPAAPRAGSVSPETVPHGARPPARASHP